MNVFKFLRDTIWTEVVTCVSSIYATVGWGWFSKGGKEGSLKWGRR